jgi:hypothetical protein
MGQEFNGFFNIPSVECQRYYFGYDKHDILFAKSCQA